MRFAVDGKLPRGQSTRAWSKLPKGAVGSSALEECSQGWRGACLGLFRNRVCKGERDGRSLSTSTLCQAAKPDLEASWRV